MCDFTTKLAGGVELHQPLQLNQFPQNTPWQPKHSKDLSQARSMDFEIGRQKIGNEIKIDYRRTC